MQVRPTYTVTPTGPHSLKFTTQYGNAVDCLLKSNNLTAAQTTGNNVSRDENSGAVLLKASVSVQTTNPSDADENSARDKENTSLFKARDCCLDIASRALEKSEEIGRESKKGLQGLLGDGTEPWDLNSSEDLIQIISTGDLFKDGAFGRENSEESRDHVGTSSDNTNQYQLPRTSSDNTNQYQLPRPSWGRQRQVNMVKNRQVPKLIEITSDDEEAEEVILDEITGLLKRQPTAGRSEDIRPSASEVETPQLTEVILDERSGQFINSHSKKLTADFNTKCSVESNPNSSSGTETLMVCSDVENGDYVKANKELQKSGRNKSESLRKGEPKQDNSTVHAETSMFRPWMEWAVTERRPKRVSFRDDDKQKRQPMPAHTDERKLRLPRPAHTATPYRSAPLQHKWKYEEDEGEAIDLRKSCLGLQVDGNDDSRESVKSETAEKSETTKSASIIQPEDEASGEQSIQGDQTLSEYSEIYGENSTQKTPTEPSSPPSEMLVSPDSTVQGYQYYYRADEENEYQPEQYGNMLTSSSESFTDSKITQSEKQSSSAGYDRKMVKNEVCEKSNQATASCDELLASFEGSSSVSQSVEGMSPSTNPSSVTSVGEDIKTEVQKEARRAIATCDAMLASVDGSHLDMSTISVISSGSMNTTTDLRTPQDQYHQATQQEMMTGFTSSSTDLGSGQDELNNGCTTLSTVSLEVMENDSKYENFRRGITASSSPHHDADTLAPTQICGEENKENEKRPLESTSDEEKKTPSKRRRTFKKAAKKSDIKSSERKCPTGTVACTVSCHAQSIGGSSSQLASEIDDTSQNQQVDHAEVVSQVEPAEVPSMETRESQSIAGTASQEESAIDPTSLNVDVEPRIVETGEDSNNREDSEVYPTAQSGAEHREETATDAGSSLNSAPLFSQSPVQQSDSQSSSLRSCSPV